MIRPLVGIGAYILACIVAVAFLFTVADLVAFRWWVMIPAYVIAQGFVVWVGIQLARRAE